MPLHHLQVGEWSAEQMSVGGPPKRFVQRTARKAERSGANRGAEHIERRHRDLEAVAGVANERGRRHAAPVESEPRQRMRCHDFKALGDGKARVVRFNDESGKPARARRFAGAGKNDVKVGNAAVRNPVLLAVKDETISVAAGDSSDIRDIRPGRWFGPFKSAATL